MNERKYPKAEFVSGKKHRTTAAAAAARVADGVSFAPVCLSSFPFPSGRRENSKIHLRSQSYSINN